MFSLSAVWELISLTLLVPVTMTTQNYLLPFLLSQGVKCLAWRHGSPILKLFIRVSTV